MKGKLVVPVEKKTRGIKYEKPCMRMRNTEEKEEMREKGFPYFIKAC